MTINDMKVAVLAMMRAKYAPLQSYSEITDANIETAGLMLASHATTIRNCCNRNSYIATFRSAGAASLDRIKKGNPCKGHNILTKSIKNKGTTDATWTYTHFSGIESYAGLVGNPVSSTNPALQGIWKFNASNPGSPLTDPIARIQTDQTIYYTGDYDMHDLIKNNQRILATTVDEASAIDALNNAIFNVESTRKSKVVGGQRTFDSEYSLIRHGAQTSFMSYLLSSNGQSEIKIPSLARIPSQGEVIKIDDSIVAFTPDQKAYLLDSVAKVYAFYSNNNLLDQIPFYYFFDDLSKTPGNATTIAGYSTTINGYLAHLQA